MATSTSGKEVEIARLLSEGTPPAELIRQGHARGTVYKVSRRRRAEHAALEPDGQAPGASDPAVEDDPEVVALKKALRMAQLERQLSEVKGPTDLDIRLSALDEGVDELYEWLNKTSGAHVKLKARVDGSPLAGIRKRFHCSCGAAGLVAATVVCTSCGLEQQQGWWPDHPG